VIKIVTVSVRENNVEQALRILKKKTQREGLYRELKQRRFFEAPCEKRKRKAGESLRRERKRLRKENMLFGF
jgi:small subunit ribosomal protein S21